MSNLARMRADFFASGNMIIRNARIVTPIGRKALSGKEMASLKVIEKGNIIIKKGVITFVGSSESHPFLDFENEDWEEIDAKGNVVLPGFIDSHTHLVFGGFREDEFQWRLKGESYMSIMERGGGIQSTVNATRQESKESLVAKSQWFIDRMAEMGVTTVEAKSGYGLDPLTELKMLEVIDTLASDPEQNLRIIPTFLGAHAVPPEFKGNTSGFVDLIINDMLPKARNLSKFCDVFCEKNVFELEDTRRLLSAAKELGFKLKMHADEIVPLGGAELAADLGAVSADHLLHVSEEGIKKMADAGVVATLLPLTAFSLKEEYAPARRMIDSGCAVALATDLNPGSCFSGSIPLTIALACIYMKMSIEEVITALTLNGAAAVDMADSIGSIEEGKSGDLVILGCDNINVLPYYIGMNCVRKTIFKGRLVYDDFFSEN